MYALKTDSGYVNFRKPFGVYMNGLAEAQRFPTTKAALLAVQKHQAEVTREANQCAPWFNILSPELDIVRLKTRQEPVVTTTMRTVEYTEPL